MIRLKLLLEKESKKSSSVIKALFVGDSQTVYPNSYAKILAKNKNVSAKIVAKRNASLEDIYTMLQDNMSDRYDVVTVMCGDIDSKEKNYKLLIQQLREIYSFVKQFDCVLVAITTPNKDFTKDPDKYPSDDKLAKYIRTQNISDVTINLGKLDNVDFSKDGLLLDQDIHRAIAEEWISKVRSRIDTDIETPEETPKQVTSGEVKLNSDADIRQLQINLASLGYVSADFKINGILDTETNDAIRQFQRKNGIDDTGIYNSETETALNKELNLSSKDDEWKLVNLAPKKRKKIKGNTTNANEVIEFFEEKGLSVAGAAGIAGNLSVESEFKTYNPGDNGTSNGLAQWHNERWTGPNGFEAWCKDEGLDPWSVEGQLEFLWWELTTKYSSLTTYLRNEDIEPEDAAQEFAEKFERPTYISPERSIRARKYYDDYTSFF